MLSYLVPVLVSRLLGIYSCKHTVSECLGKQILVRVVYLRTVLSRPSELLDKLLINIILRCARRIVLEVHFLDILGSDCRWNAVLYRDITPDEGHLIECIRLHAKTLRLPMLVLHFSHAWVSLLDAVDITYDLVCVSYCLLVVVPVALYVLVVTVLLVGLDSHELSGSRVSAVSIVCTALSEHHSVKEDSLLHHVALEPAVVHSVNKARDILLCGILRLSLLIHLDITFVIACLRIEIQFA